MTELLNTLLAFSLERTPHSLTDQLVIAYMPESKETQRWHNLSSRLVLFRGTGITRLLYFPQMLLWVPFSSLPSASLSLFFCRTQLILNALFQTSKETFRIFTLSGSFKCFNHTNIFSVSIGHLCCCWVFQVYFVIHGTLCMIISSLAT